MSTEPVNRTIRIQTGARLHFGPLSYHPIQGRHFGGIGMMIDSPGWDLELSHPVSLTAKPTGHVVGEERDRVAEVLNRFRTSALSSCTSLNAQIRILRSLKSHQGLGSGTQLALALGTGLCLLAGHHVDPRELAHWFGRGRRSMIGLTGFATGGFLVDGGQERPGTLGTLACRVEIPSDWRFVLIAPGDTGAEVGLCGEPEQRAFQHLAPMAIEVTQQLCQLVVMQLLPALHAKRCDLFAAALEQYGRLVGEFFRPVQGGIFAAPPMRALVERLSEAGVVGMAQTSWGPTVVIPAGSQSLAESLEREVQQLAQQPVTTHIAAPRNVGVQPVPAETIGT
ncbi:MAG: hypothetical protein KDA58_04040 [Planctomycetaceae bacterium]|nr:hypothetical protein [Planctomycetaceae bacterium]